ncbi:hypothetical protein Tsubulata_025239 [Turnera subulata]|uniref:CCHC-type domain-containing protein n=1 Tax=Turnera subulata TaxID=218843 RepID=A0A9Q0F1M7_9ROSI|nr:hypothetical protein Tsubulata_025239 [Turnera subulata]
MYKELLVKSVAFSVLMRREHQGWGKFVRFKVALNVDKHLHRTLAIRKGNGASIEVSFRYEGIPNFCYLCGKLGHLFKECDLQREESDEEEVLSFREWMRASSRKPFSARLEAVVAKPVYRAIEDAHMERALSLITSTEGLRTAQASQTVTELRSVLPVILQEGSRPALEQMVEVPQSLQPRKATPGEVLAFTLGSPGIRTVELHKANVRGKQSKAKAGSNKWSELNKGTMHIREALLVSGNTDRESQLSLEGSQEQIEDTTKSSLKAHQGRKWKRRAIEGSEVRVEKEQDEMGKRKAGGLEDEEMEWESVGKRVKEDGLSNSMEYPARSAEAVDQPRQAQ